MHGMYDSGGDSKHVYHYGTDTAGFNKDKECTAHNGVLYACMRRNVRSAVQEIQEDKGKRYNKRKGAYEPKGADLSIHEEKLRDTE